MPVRTVAVDLAKNVFELAAADERGNVTERRRLSRLQLERYFQNRSEIHVVMEACGTAHHWGRLLTSRGIRVSLLPAHYVKAYVRRNKTDSADATALLEASRASDIVPVQVKSLEQQALQGMHRIRSAWQSTSPYQQVLAANSGGQALSSIPVQIRDTRVTIRLDAEDQALLRERAAARFMPAAS